MKPLLLIFLGVAAVSGGAIIDHKLQKRFLGGKTENVMVSFSQSIQTVIDQVNRMNFSSPGEKRTVLTNMQQTFTNGVQGGLQSFLSGMGVNYKSYWINNVMTVPNVNSALVQMISSVPGVAKIEKVPEVNIYYPVEGEVERNIEREVDGMIRVARQASLSWGVKQIGADQVWKNYKGKGIVVANIDTGVLYTHETLRGRWRSNLGWLNPYNYSNLLPMDNNGHGTHTMGTIAGTMGIGVAPEATWIACKGCSDRSCGGDELFECGQWIQCPYKPDGTGRDCNMAPDIVSNSWGGPGGRSWYDRIINSWQASEIFPVFSIGNSGPNCGTGGTPGDRANNIAVGSTESNGAISSFSSLGPSSDSRVPFKPDIAAPGGRIRSAWPTGDSDYNTISGTSMACPHVSGVIALMLQKNPNIKYKDVYNAIAKSADTKSLNTNSAKTCDRKSGQSFPNNVFGYGLISATGSVNAV